MRPLLALDGDTRSLREIAGASRVGAERVRQFENRALGKQHAAAIRSHEPSQDPD